MGEVRLQTSADASGAVSRQLEAANELAATHLALQHHTASGWAS